MNPVTEQPAGHADQQDDAALSPSMFGAVRRIVGEVLAAEKAVAEGRVRFWLVEIVDPDVSDPKAARRLVGPYWSEADAWREVGRVERVVNPEVSGSGWSPLNVTVVAVEAPD